MGARDAVTTACGEVLALVAPTACAGCDRSGWSVCDACQHALRGEGIGRRVLGDGTVVSSAVTYAGEAAGIIRALKEHGRLDVRPCLATALRRALEDQARGPVEVVPIPASRRGRRSRGWDVTGALVVGAGVRPLRALAWTRDARDQRALGRTEREANLAGALTVRRSVRGVSVIIADDVVTTGATIAAAAAALRGAGANVVGAATVASTPAYVGYG